MLQRRDSRPFPLRTSSALEGVLMAVLALLPLAAASAEDQVPRAVNRLVQAQAAKAAEFKDAEIAVELLETSARLSACRQPEAFFPHQQQRLRAGRMTLGLRCQGEHDRYIPVRLLVQGNYLEVSQSLMPGDVLGEHSVRVRRGDLGELPQDTLRKPAQALGKLAVRRLEPGTVLRDNHLRSRPLVKRGQNVAVESRGQGFVVKRDGVAMENGGMGDTIRVRLSRREILEAQVTKNGRLVLKH